MNDNKCVLIIDETLDEGVVADGEGTGHRAQRPHPVVHPRIGGIGGSHQGDSQEDDRAASRRRTCVRLQQLFPGSPHLQ